MRRTSLPLPAAVVLFAAAVALPLLRNEGLPYWETIWIEDSLFTQEANADGPFAVLFRSYSGYLQIPIRLLAMPTVLLPSSWWAVYLSVAAATTCALCAAFAYHQSRGLISSALSRVALAAVVVVSPAMAVENTANITNTIWSILAVAPFAFLSQESRRVDVAMRAVVAFLAATATALSVLLLPLAIGCLLVRRTRAAAVVSVSYGVGLALQAVVVVLGPGGPRDPSTVRDLLDFFAVRVLGSFLVGERPLWSLWRNGGELVALVFVLVTVGLFAYLLRGAGRRNARVAGILLAYAFALFALPAWGRGTDAIGFTVGRYSLNTTRYTVASIVLLVAAAAVLVDPALEARERALRFDGRKVLAVQVAVIIGLNYFYETVRGDGPAWRAELARVVEEECRDQPGDRVVRVTTTPVHFGIDLPCRRLTS